MSRLAATLGALWGLLLTALALTAPTAWLMLPAHLGLATLSCCAALWAGLTGAPGLARLWGGGFTLATIGVVAALELGAAASGGGWWKLPWLLLLCWSWIPPVFAGLGAWIGVRRQRQRTRRTVRRRRQQQLP